MTKKIILYLLLLLLIAANTQAKYFLFKKKYMRHYEWIKLTPKTIESKIPTPKKVSITDTTSENKDEDIQIPKNKLGRLQSALDTADEEQIHSLKNNKKRFKILLDTTFQTNNEFDIEKVKPSTYSDSIQNIELRKLKINSREVAALGTIASVLSAHLYQKRQIEIKHNKNIEPREDDYEFALIVLLMLMLLFIGRRMISYWYKWKKAILQKFKPISKTILGLSFFYYLTIALSFSLIAAVVFAFAILYIFVFIPFALIFYH
jgi:hypothetical protein